MSGEELLRARNRDQSLLPSGEKVDEAVESWLEDTMVESRLREHHNLIREPKVARKDQLTSGEWLPESQMVKVARPGKFWHHMGVETDIGKCLYPEEAVYLIDTGELEVVYDGLPLSLQQAQALLLQDRHHLEQYFVYSHLSRTGCKVVQHQPHLVFTKYEKDIRLDQHQTSKKGVKLKLGSDNDSPQNAPQSQPVDAALEELYACLGDAAVNPLMVGKDEVSSSVKSTTITAEDKKESRKKASNCDKEALSPHEVRRRELIEMFPTMSGQDVMFVDVEPAELLPKNSVPSRNRYKISIEALEYYSVYDTRHHYHYQGNIQRHRNWNKQDQWNRSRNGRWGSDSERPNWRSRDDYSERGNRWQQHSQPQWDSHDRRREERSDRWGPANDSNWRHHSNSNSDMGYRDRHGDSGHSKEFSDWHGDYGDSYQSQHEEDDIDYSVWPEWKRKRRPMFRQQGREGFPSALVRLGTKVSSWKEYKREVAERKAKKELTEGGTRVLWEGRTTPLFNPHINPSPAPSVSANTFSTTLLSSCNLDAAVTDVGVFKNIIPQEAQLKVVYDVYLPTVAYKKSNPPIPSKRVAVMRDGAMPSPGQILEVSSRFVDNVAVACAVVTGGEVRLYTFTPMNLPSPQPYTS